MSQQSSDPRRAAEGPSSFDRLASSVSTWLSKAWFFVGCVGLVVVWAPTVVLLEIDTWQLIINTVTTIVTFLLVALLQNTRTGLARNSVRGLHQHPSRDLNG